MDPSPAARFTPKMALYVRVRRHGSRFISDDPAEPLETVLELCMKAVNGNVSVVSTAHFDVAHYLHEIVQVGAKTMSTALNLAPDIVLTLTLTIKALGENHLTPYTGPVENTRPQAMARLPDSPENDEAVAALELERLRHDVREREGRINALADSTHRLDAAVQQHARQADNSVPAGEAAALRVDNVSLKERCSSLEHQSSEMERKISAHVTHAAKIKTTYNQLAAWYNNLRNEHMELQKKHPGSASEQTQSSRDLPAVVSMTHEADMKMLEKERDELQALLKSERSEKSNMHSRNAELLGAKARTLAELKEQWDSAQSTLVATKKVLDEQSKQLKDLNETIDNMKFQLAEKDSLVVERASQISKVEKEAKDREAVHLDALEALKKCHQEETERGFADSNAVDEAVAKAVREQQAKHDEDLMTLRRESARKVEEAVDRMQKGTKGAEVALKEAEEKLAAVENEKQSLGAEMSTLLKERDADATGEAEVHKKALEQMRAAKEEMQMQITQMTKQVDKEKQVTEESQKEKGRNEELEAELKKVLAELSSLRKETEDLNSSPRQIAMNRVHSDKVPQLERDILTLKSLLKTETGKRNESEKLLASADDEHDELRAMVSRLRLERNEALDEVNLAKDAANRVAQRQGSGSSDQDSDPASLLEERDKAIRELFRVRKTMNKEIRRLKKENISLAVNGPTEQNDTVEQREIPNANGATLVTLRKERDIAVSELEKIRTKLSIVGSKSDSGRAATGNADEISVRVSQKLDFYAGELDSSARKNAELKNALNSKAEEYTATVERIRFEKDGFQKDAQKMQVGLQNAIESSQGNEKRNAELSNSMKSLDRKVIDIRESQKGALQERDDARQKAAALQAELASLKKSLDAASSSSSSTETLLRDAQRELAESKAKIELLHGEVVELKEAALTKEQERQEEITRLETAVEHTSRDLSSRLARTEQEQSKVHSEKEEKSKENSKLEVLVQKLQSFNASLTAKLAAEKNLKDGSQKLLAETETKAAALFEEVRGLRDGEKSTTEAVTKLAAEKENALVALTEAKSRLESTVSRLTEHRTELNQAKGRIKSVETSREVIQKEASVAGGKSAALADEMAALRAELKQSQSDLQTSSRDLQIEAQKNSGMVDKESQALSSLKERNENLNAQLTDMGSNLESSQDELRVIKDSYSTLESVLEKVQEKAMKMSRVATERKRECAEVKAAHADMRTENERFRAQYEAFGEQSKQVRIELAATLKEVRVLRSEKQAFAQRIKSLEVEMGSVSEQFSSVQEESSEMVEMERANTEKEMKKAGDLRKEVRAARSKAEALEAEVERLRANNQGLLTSSRENGERDAEVLSDLINTRMELAYSREETIRLRNKLQKTAQSGSGSASFEY